MTAAGLDGTPSLADQLLQGLIALSDHLTGGRHRISYSVDHKRWRRVAWCSFGQQQRTAGNESVSGGWTPKISSPNSSPHMPRPWQRSASLVSAASLALCSFTAIAPQAALAEVLVRAQGRCKLSSGGYVPFNGHCTFKHKQAGGVDAYVVKLDDGTEFNFSGPNPQALSVQTHAGIRNVRHTAQPDHDVFSWEDGEPRKLSVRLDRVENPDAGFDTPPQKADSTALVGAALGALIGGLISGKPAQRSEAATQGAPVGELQSLVGARASGAEATITGKGYTYRGGAKSDGSSFTYWEQPRTNNCVAVRTTDGRYQSITYTTKADCN